MKTTAKIDLAFTARRSLALVALAASCFQPARLAAEPPPPRPPGAPKTESETQDAEAARKKSEARRRALRPAAELKLGGKKISVAYQATSAESADFKRLDALKPGEVVQFTQSQAIKLKTEASLKFGEAVIKSENVAKKYPGVYSLWIKKTGRGWALLFNERADVFGTQHDAKADVAEVPLDQAAEFSGLEPKLKIELAEAGEGKGKLAITWGARQWMAPFALADAPNDAPAAPTAKESKPAAAARPADPKALTNTVAFTPESVAEGKGIYLRNCQRCHGVDGRALENIDFEATDLTRPETWIYGTTDGEAFVSTKFGSGKDMPPFEGKLDDAQIWKIVNHIKSLWPKDAKPVTAQ